MFRLKNTKAQSLVYQKQKYAPSVFEKYVTTVNLEGKEIELTLNDTAGKRKFYFRI